MKTKKQNNELLFRLLNDRDRIEKERQEIRQLLLKKQTEYEAVNKMICDHQGHTMTPWEKDEHPFLEGHIIYKRQCSICGKRESIEQEPEEYRNDQQRLSMHID